MAKSEVSMNVSAIRLVDRHVVDILDTAAHVALYEFNGDSCEWEKTKAEGALFIYSRASEPRYGIIVLNRLSTLNLVEYVNEGLELQLQEPFLLYKNSKCEIHGIWFYDKEECVRIAKSLEKFIRAIRKSKSIMEGQVKNSDFMKSPQPEVPDGTSKRVMDFFARAGTKAPSLPPGPRTPQAGTPLSRDKLLILQRLMTNSNPITVEQLEKQQRNSPQDNNKIQLKTIMKKETPKRPLTLPVGQPSPQVEILENGMNLLQMAESPPPGYTPSQSIPTQHFFNSGLAHSPSGEPLELSAVERSVTSLDTPSKPALIPPVMFASSKEEPMVIKPEPLTKSQLLQAVTYLLKNDSDFINKLHEAYVKSFVDMVS